ncbi:unnamed protein product [Zymoseptoria tritici ST99CH_3D7]|uniref:Major facilitator superfamily (MFS) profile domain-containing protein n=2 Tax=Zymoseptoria tritici TaxID=1047171 RepID=A0A1X7RS02_ZYMT9|nr:unnamed protein product [Zymoseptoria tritici ST99CH_3D7]
MAAASSHAEDPRSLLRHHDAEYPRLDSDLEASQMKNRSCCYFIRHTSMQSDPDTGDGLSVAAAKVRGIISAVMEANSSHLLCMLGLAVMITVYALEITSAESYNVYALSEFKALSMQSSAEVTDSIIAAVSKLPVAKVSEAIGPMETYCILAIMYIISSLLRFEAQSLELFAVGALVAMLAHAGTAIMNLIMISSLTSARIRGLAMNAFFLPMLITPLLAGVVVEKVVAGPGWRLGFGLFAFVMPLGAAGLIVSLYHLQHKARFEKPSKIKGEIHLAGVSSQVDAGGLILLSGGLALFLLPITVYSKTTDGDTWMTARSLLPMVLGLILLACVIPWERYMATQPAIPLHYFHTRGIAAPLVMVLCESMAFSSAHVYLIPFAVAARGFDAGSGVYLSQTCTVTQIITGIIVGVAMYRLRRYRSFATIGGMIRVIGNGLMIRLRSSSSSDAELFLAEVLQGLGRGMIDPAIFLSAQVMVPAAELGQVTALIAMMQHLGGALGAAIAGGIYASNMKSRLRFHLRNEPSQSVIDDIYSSLTGGLPGWGTPERWAVRRAYSDIMGYITVLGLGLSIAVAGFAFLMPDKRLVDGHDLAAALEAHDDESNIRLSGDSTSAI